MKKNIIVCCKNEDAISIKDMADALYFKTQTEIDSILNEQSELRKEIDKIISSPGDISLSKIYDIPHKKEDILFKKISNDFSNISCGFSRIEKANKLIDIFNKRDLELKKDRIEIIPLYNVVSICTNFNDLQKTLTTTTDIDGIVVFCELDWGDYDSTDNLKGITLVQRYIRYEKKLKAPVVFSSVLKQKDILSKRPDANIISTPALQHKFIRFSFDVEELFNGFRDMKNMTKRQLDYTIDRFCNLKGLLSHIKHNVHGCSNDSLNSYKTQLLYAVKMLFDNNADKISEVNAASTDKDLEKICKKYIDELQNDNKNANIKIVDYICDSKEKQLRTLILDDNEQDDYTNRLVSCMNQIHDKVSSTNQLCSIEKPVVTRTIDEFFNQLGQNDSFFNNIILDVEIWNKAGELEALGFDIAEEIRSRISSPIQINMITNTTRSLHSKLIDNFNNDVIKGIFLKEEILSSDTQALSFIKNICHDWDAYITLFKTPQFDCCKVLHKLINTVRRRMPNDVKMEIDFNKISNAGKSDIRSYTITNYDEFEITVKDLSTELIKRFLLECSNKATDDITWSDFNNVCSIMRTVIGNSIGLGNEKLIDKVMGKYKKGNNEPEADDIVNFISRLVLRRFFLYLKLFIKKYEITRKFDDIKTKNPDREDIKWKYRDADLACRAISKQFKRPYINDDYTTSKQSKCLTETLLYSIKIDEKDQLSEEEKTFIEAINNNRNSFNYITNVKNLTFEY